MVGNYLSFVHLIVTAGARWGGGGRGEAAKERWVRGNKVRLTSYEGHNVEADSDTGGGGGEMHSVLGIL